MHKGSDPRVPNVPAQAQTTPSVPRVAAPGRRARIDSIDLLRGIAMVVMALDHVRDFFTDVRFDPLDLSQTTPYLFLTRWVTHHCAPAFVFLAGTGTFLYQSRGRTRGDVAKFLLSRGLWLIVLELTVVRFAWLFNLDYSFVFVQVIWAIGWSMIALAVLIFLPRGWLAFVSFGMIALHNLTDSVGASAFGSAGWLWQILHVQGPIMFGDHDVLLVIYPLIPWIGVMGAGYLFGSTVLEEEGVRRRKMYTIGLVTMAGFIFIRALNMYGDPRPWSVQDSLVKTFMSFLNTSKYPPSLLYLMMTLGPAITILPLLERWQGKVARFTTVFGRVPLFYYVIHLYLIHVIALFAARHTVGYFDFLTSNAPFENFPPQYGFPLTVVYAVWIGVILVLYLPCKWYADLKRKSNNRLLSYL